MVLFNIWYLRYGFLPPGLYDTTRLKMGFTVPVLIFNSRPVRYCLLDSPAASMVKISPPLAAEQSDICPPLSVAVMQSLGINIKVLKR